MKFLIMQSSSASRHFLPQLHHLHSAATLFQPFMDIEQYPLAEERKMKYKVLILHYPRRFIPDTEVQ
jgi:hypothetical protein